jgi:hypothetical protein
MLSTIIFEKQIGAILVPGKKVLVNAQNCFTIVKRSIERSIEEQNKNGDQRQSLGPHEDLLRLNQISKVKMNPF